MGARARELEGGNSGLASNQMSIASPALFFLVRTQVSPLCFLCLMILVHASGRICFHDKAKESIRINIGSVKKV
jgi:hypothetical protein